MTKPENPAVRPRSYIPHAAAVIFGVFLFSFDYVFLTTPNARDMQYRSSSLADAQLWQAQLRARLAMLLQIQDLTSRDTPIPLNADVQSKTQHEGYEMYEVAFNATPTHRITATVTLPNASSPAPAVICIPGHHSSRRDVYEGGKEMYHGFATALAERGYATIAVDVAQHDVRDKKRTLMGERLWDLVRCIDYLESLPQIQKDRIGCAGLSLGGEMAMWLGAMDTRISATLSAGWLTNMDQLGPHHCGCWHVPGLRELVDFADIYALTAPRPLLCQNGIHEYANQFPVSKARDAMAEIRVTYQDMASPENVDLVCHDGEHEIDVPSLLTFFERHLGGTHTLQTLGNLGVDRVAR